MSILRDDIKLLASERMIDTEDGGGRITGNVIESGTHNSMFADISDLDRAYGAVNMRKIFLGVETDNTDTYYGAHATVLMPPADPNVAVTLFTTKDHNDERADARDRIERYLARGPKWQGFLYETQLEGQRAILVFQREETRLPEVGEVLTLVADENLPTEYEQYIRVKRVTSELRSFRVEGLDREFTRRVVTIEITDPLRHTFEGIFPTPYDNVKSPTNMRETVVADASKYYAASPMVEPAAFGAMRVKVDSIFTQLVPSARSETPAVDLTAAGENAALVNSASGPVSFSTVAAIAPNRGMYLGTGAVPGSVSITIGAAVIKTDGRDLVVAGTIVGSIDYARGQLEFNNQCPNYGTASKTVTFTPAAAPIRVADTASIAIDANTRGYAHTITLRPIPAPGSLRVSYMAQGKWYDLMDNGAGQILGADSSFGSGQLSFVTGSLILTLGALPDVETEILLSWSGTTNYFNRSGLTPEPGEVVFTASKKGIMPGSATITWDENGTPRTLTDNGVGKLTGFGSGTINYMTGEVKVRPQQLPSGGAEIEMVYQYGPPLQQPFNAPLRNPDGTVTLQMTAQNLTPGAVRVTYLATYDAVPPDNTEYSSWFSSTLGDIFQQNTNGQVAGPDVVLRDNGAGGLLNQLDQQVGTVDYVTGKLTFKPEGKAKVPVTTSTWVTLAEESAGIWVTAKRKRWVYTGLEYREVGYQMPLDGWVLIDYRTGNEGTMTDRHPINALQVDLTPRYGEVIKEGSVMFDHGGRRIIDRLGLLYTNIDHTTGAGQQVGTFDYNNGIASLTNWLPGAGNTPQLKSLLTSVGGQHVDEVTFRTPGAPLRVGSLYISATTLVGGELIDIVASNTGIIDGSRMRGTVNYETGIVRVQFGEYVPSGSVQNEPWFDPEEVREDGTIWKPVSVLAETIRYNCVVLSYLPLDADLIGLDPVRLPSDGRVPVFRNGDIAVVHNTKKTAFPSGVTAGQSLFVERTRLSRLWLEDATGKVLPENRYQVDLDAGTVTLATPLDLTGFTQPLVAVHRIEDMSLVTDVEISGQLTLARPLSHDYDTDSVVSSALIAGDIWSRVRNVFDQKTWTGEFRDTRIGDETAAQYNATDFPLQVTNRGAIEQRWAIVFTGSTSFKVIGEHVGQIATGDTNTECAPINPNTKVPYFRLNPLGWGSGWATNNVLRFNTQGANFPIWVIRTVLQSVAAQNEDQFELQLRGNVNV